MNIFVLDENPRIAARYHCDKHVVKMITESAQMLSTTHTKYNSQIKNQYKPAHQNHPCTIWVGTNDKNYYWTWCLFYWLSIEYEQRYRRVHQAARSLLKSTLELPAGIPIAEAISPFVLAMPDQYKTKSAVESYRDYYRGDKARFARWAYCETPYWWNEE